MVSRARGKSGRGKKPATAKDDGSVPARRSSSSRKKRVPSITDNPLSAGPPAPEVNGEAASGSGEPDAPANPAPDESTILRERQGDAPPRGSDDKRPCLTAAQAKPTPLEMLVDGLCFRRGVSVIAGDSSKGKTTIVFNLMARLAAGLRLPNGFQAPPIRVAGLLGEADIKGEALGALAAAGARMENVLLPQLLPDGSERTFRFPAEIATLGSYLDWFRPQVLFIDPLTSFLVRDYDVNGSLSVRQLIGEFYALGRKLDLATIFTMHLNKDKGGKAGGRIAGSHEFMSAPRPVWMVGEHPSIPGTYVFACQKPGSMRKPASLAYTLPGAGEFCGVKWGGEVSVTADEILAALEDAGERDAGRDAEVFLMLALDAGDRPASELEKEAEDQGIRWRTLRRAKKRLHITSHPIGGNDDRYFVWRKPDGGFPRSIRPGKPAAQPSTAKPDIGESVDGPVDGQVASVGGHGVESPKLFTGKEDKDENTHPGAA